MKSAHRLAIATSALCFAAAPGAALSYQSVRCPEAKAYAGARLHASPLEQDIAVRGSLSGVLSPAVRQELQMAFEKGLAASPQARSVAVTLTAPEGGSWSASRYAADDAPSALFHWGSAGKMFTAAVILQMVEERRIRLEDRIATWTPSVPNAQAITIEHLLTHTSGLFSANEDLQVRRKRRPLSFDEQVDVLKRHGAMFCPGERWRYSNSGYAVLGRIIELVDRKTYAQSVQDRIVRPLGLKQTVILGPGVPPPAMAKIISPTKERSLDAFAPGPAGAVVASPPDMIRFLQAYLDGELTPSFPASRLLERAYPGFDDGASFGRGVMLYDVPDTPRPVYLIGHAGGGPGVNAIVAWSPPERAFIAAALTGGGSSMAFANVLLKTYAKASAQQ